MATATIAKSVMRENFNITVGFGEVPSVEVEGILGWGFPGGIVTFSEEEAIQMAIKLDQEIRHRTKNAKQLLSA